MQDAITITAGAVVCADTDIRGQVTVGTVIHPKCQIIAEAGPIVIGHSNILSEGTTVINRANTPMVIGHFNTFEIASEFYGVKAGDHSTIEARGTVHEGATLGNHCVVAPGCTTEPNEVLSDYTVIYGALNQRRQLINDDQAQAQLFTKHLKYLQDMLPRYNHVRKPTVA